MPAQRSTIIGLGLSGALLALSLRRYSSTIPTIYELRASPSTLGGAINLTPPVSRILASLGLITATKEIAFETTEIGIFSLRSGAKLGALPFTDAETGYTSLRVERALLLALLLRALEEAGVRVVFGKCLESVREVGEKQVAAVFADGEEVESDLLFGCDGIHSLVRGAYVEPDRKATYSGLSSAYGFVVPPEGLAGKEGFEGTAVATGTRGSVILSYCGPGREKVFVGAVMEVKAPEGDRDGWRGKGAMGAEAKKELMERFGGGDRVFKAAVEGVEEWSFFPVWVLPNGGTYWRGRTVLVGDAAHAGPPGGEGAALAMEDAVVLGRLVGKAETEGGSMEAVCKRYDELRRERVMENYTRAAARWEGAKNRSWLFQQVMEFFMWAFLMASWNKRGWGFDYDAGNVELGGRL